MPRPSVDRPLTIGAVLKGLREEFPDVSEVPDWKDFPLPELDAVPRK